VIAVVLPTRGTVFTETVIGLLKATEGYDTRFYLSHNLPTPDSFNALVEEAMKDGCDKFFITNDDVVVTKSIFKNLIESKQPINCAAVNMTENFHGYYEKDGEVDMCGTSCLMVDREVFEKMTRPYFRTDIRYITQGGEEKEVIDKKGKAWGGEEVYFSRQVRKLGYKINLVEGRARHLRLIKLGEKHSNNGCHIIEDL